MPLARQVTLTRRGDAAHDATLDEVQRAFDQMRADVNGAEPLAGASSAHWANVPASKDAAINRLASAVFGLLGAPIP